MASYGSHAGDVALGQLSWCVRSAEATQCAHSLRGQKLQGTGACAKHSGHFCPCCQSRGRHEISSAFHFAASDSDGRTYRGITPCTNQQCGLPFHTAARTLATSPPINESADNCCTKLPLLFSSMISSIRALSSWRPHRAISVVPHGIDWMRTCCAPASHRSSWSKTSQPQRAAPSCPCADPETFWARSSASVAH